MSKRADKAHSEEFLGAARDYWWNDDYLALLSRRLKLESCDTLVDVGCGKGYMGFKFARYLKPHALIYGLDKEEKYIAEANQISKLRQNANLAEFCFQVGDVNEISLPNGIADVVVCQTLLIHVNDPLKVIIEMKRITKNNGLVVAIEPNNLVNSMIKDNVFSEDIVSQIENVEVQMRIQLGKKLLGEGYDSLGDRVPQLFCEAGLQDIQVWIVDKALSIIPPYDSEEKMLRIQEILTWIENEQAALDYVQQRRYYLQGGGMKEKFERYWRGLNEYFQRVKAAAKAGTYISSGGGLMYIVAGKKVCTTNS